MITEQKAKGRNASRARYLSPDELSIFCEQVALILSSGVALYDGVEALCSNYKGTHYEAAFDSVNQAVKETGALHEALLAAQIFPPYMVQMVKIGEQTGKLDDVLASLSAYYAREQKIKRSVQNAVIYPACLIAMMAVVILVLVVKVLPIFNDVYRSLGAEVSGTASTLMNFGMSVGMVVLILAGVVTVVALVIALLLRTGARDAVLEWLGKLIRPVGRLRTCRVAGRFAINMSMMLASGFPLEEALPLIEGVMEDPKSREKIKACQEAMAAGTSFPDAIAAVDMFDSLHNKMIQIGFMTGRTDSVMAKLSDIYQEQMDEDISHLVSLIEPSMVVVLSIIIGAILLSVMLPMVSIMSSIL
ncbi:MAG: type II secretion system F family protein [Oscillospiraceae bacterium]|jgi:type IV pilus assembly protein PilC|nr:type II secretion system F family protein [Oscillospiraceae bacterium]